jgi:hypothetical protein
VDRSSRVVRSTGPQPLRCKRPAHQSLFTDVFGSRLLLCTIHQCKNFTMSPRGDGKIVRCVLDWGVAALGAEEALSEETRQNSSNRPL